MEGWINLYFSYEDTNFEFPEFEGEIYFSREEAEENSCKEEEIIKTIKINWEEAYE